jgi:cysteinyl-tRNA synthetase
LLQADPETYLQQTATAGGDTAVLMPADEVDALIARRISARSAKDWAEADRIRDALDAAGIIIEDGAAGSTWRRS